MKEIFGVSMNVIMATLLVVFLLGIAAIALLALRNRVMFRMGVRPITRRWGQTALIVIGVMLSTVIISAALGTGDTLSVSIRQETLNSLKTIDEVIVPTFADAEDTFGTSPFVDYERFERLQQDVAHLDTIDGLMPQLAVVAPSVNTRTKLNEGFLNVVGLEPSLLQGFGPLETLSGGEASLASLGSREAYINESAAEELEAVAGDRLDLYVKGEPLAITVKGIVEKGGLAGRGPTMMMPLSQVQEIFGREGEINTIIVSNAGDTLGGVEHSKEVTKELRVLFNDRAVASRLKELLRQDAVVAAIQAREEDMSDELRSDVAELRAELAKDDFTAELNSLLSDEDVVNELTAALDDEELGDVRGEALTLFEELSEFRVIEFKRNLLELADQAGSFVTTFFLVMSLFSIAVGALLIFLIFIMLASARRPEMGMARAIGAKRNHLVKMFTFEGTAYALVSAAVGVALGLAVSAVMIFVINRLFASFDDSFSLTIHLAPRSIVVSYCLGMVITVATVAGSAYRVSRLNIVAAVRNIPETVEVASRATLRHRSAVLLRSLGRPGIFLWRGVRALISRRFGRFAGYTLLGLVWVFPVFWIADVVFAVLRFVWPYLLAGWLTLLAGAGLAAYGIWGVERAAVFTAGASLTIIGLGLFLRVLAGRGMRLEVFGAILLVGGTALLAYFVTLGDALAIAVAVGLAATGAAMLVPFFRGRVEPRADIVDRLAFTFLGVLMLAFWIMPADPWPDLIAELESNFEMMFVSGVFMVAAAVWTIMYNADLLLGALTAATGRAGMLRPVLVTAVAYPLSNKVRTGLTLAMFALVIFTLMVMSILTNIFSGQFSDADDVLGGWEVDGRVNANTPIEDIRQRIVDHPDLRIEDFEAIGGFTSLGAQARQVGGESQVWEGTQLVGADDAYLGATGFTFKLIAEGYGDTDRDVWQALIDNPNLAVVGGYLAQVGRERAGQPGVPARPAGRLLQRRRHEAGAAGGARAHHPRGRHPDGDRRHGPAAQERRLYHDFEEGPGRRRALPGADHQLPLPAGGRRRRSDDQQGDRVGVPGARDVQRRRCGGVGERGRGGQGLRPPVHRLHGAGAARRHRRTGDRQHPGRGRAPPADRRPSGHRVPPQDGPAQLPDRVVVRIAAGHAARSGPWDHPGLAGVHRHHVGRGRRDADVHRPLDRDRLHPGGHLRLLGTGDVPAGKAGVQDLPSRSPTLRVARSRRRVAAALRLPNTADGGAMSPRRYATPAGSKNTALSSSRAGTTTAPWGNGVAPWRTPRRPWLRRGSYGAGIRIFGWGRCHLTPLTLSAPTLRRGVSKGPHNSVFGRGRCHHWRKVACARRFAPVKHWRYSG